MAAPINIQGLLADGATGSDYGTRTTDVIAITTSVAIPRGLWLLETDADVIVRKQTDAAGTYVTWLAVSSQKMLWSDGYSLEWRGGAAGGSGIRTGIRALSPTKV